MRPANEANNKRDPTKTKKQEAKTRRKPTKNEVKTESEEKQEEGPKKSRQGRTQTATTQPPTHYELGSRAPVRAASNDRLSVLGATG
jgi:hypothetical protein